jgi:signal transduction histidine kinase
VLKPNSLLGRMVLVLASTLAIASVLMGVAFVRDRDENAARREVMQSADRIAMALSFARTGRVSLPIEAGGLRLQVDPIAADLQPAASTFSANDLLFMALLRPHLDGAELTHAQAGPDYAVRLRLPGGERIRITVVHTPPAHAAPPPPWRAFAGLAGALAVALALATVWVTRPMRRLVEAANHIDTLGLTARLDEYGPNEVAVVLRAFNRMRDRIDFQTADRVRVLQGVSHDLKTPLTRLRFRIDAMVDETLRKAVLEDIASMQAMIAGALNYARMLDSGQPSELVDLAALLRAVCDDANNAGGQAQVSYRAPLYVTARPAALHRAFANLVDNAIRYGGRAEVTIEANDTDIVVKVRDGGVGINGNDLARAFEPYYRGAAAGDASYGSGLGLSIARDCFISHGGHVELKNHPDAGMEVSVRLTPASASAIAF